MPDRAGVLAAAERFANLGGFHHRFVTGKLRHDPVYTAVACGGILPERGTLVDLGCGRGILLAALFGTGSALRLVGIEQSRTVEVARRALDGRATVVHADLRDAVVPACDAATLVDVLHYLDRRAQEDLLERAVDSLRPGGVLVVREVDGRAGWGFLAVRIAERMRSIGRGEPFRAFHYRSREEWGALLRRCGLSVSVRPMGEGTPFANILLVGTKPAGVRTPEVPSSPPAPR